LGELLAGEREGEKGRLPVAACRCAVGRRTVIVTKLEKGGLLDQPRGGALLFPQPQNLAPEVWLAVDLDEARRDHG
jgi:hypothetical protein